MGLSVIAARIWLGIQFGVAGTRVRNWLSLAIALAGMPSIDAKLAWRDPSLWQPLSATTSIAPYWDWPAGVRASDTPTVRAEPAPSVKELTLRRTSDSAARRLGDTSPLRPCSHGRSATLTAIDVLVVFEIVIEPTLPRLARCSKMPGEIDRPPPAPRLAPVAVSITTVVANIDRLML